jgi:hypothetical protein
MQDIKDADNEIQSEPTELVGKDYLARWEGEIKDEQAILPSIPIPPGTLQEIRKTQKELYKINNELVSKNRELDSKLQKRNARIAHLFVLANQCTNGTEEGFWEWIELAVRFAAQCKMGIGDLKMARDNGVSSFLPRDQNPGGIRKVVVRKVLMDDEID